MDDLLYFALWGAAIFLMMRFGCGAHMMGHGHGKKRGSQNPERPPAEPLRWVPPDKDTDPVCGKSVMTEQAKPSVYAGNVFYFCSRECREAFEAAPDLYMGDSGPNQSRLEHLHA